MNTTSVSQNNTATGKAAGHNGKMPSSANGVGAAVSAAYGRSTPVKPDGTPQTGYRMDLPGQSSR